MTREEVRRGPQPFGPPPSLHASSPAALKVVLSLQWTLGYLFGLWNVGRVKVICPNPRHKDDTPSFNLWSLSSDGHFTKFGCYGCSWKGDVLDLIQLKYGCDFSKAMDIGFDDLLPLYRDQLAHGYDEKEYEPEIVSQEDLEAQYHMLCLQGHNRTSYLCYLARKSMLAIGNFGHEEWGWTGHQRSISTPHYNADGFVTGVKFRDTKDPRSKWSLSGSEFNSLYGAWRDSRKDNVVLCEGESDTVWASFHLKERNCDVLGIPTGAARGPNDSNLTELDGRTVYLMFDGDEGGRLATSLWYPRLARAHIIEVPEGEDLVSCNIPIASLLRNRSN